LRTGLGAYAAMVVAGTATGPEYHSVARAAGAASWLTLAGAPEALIHTIRGAVGDGRR
jgi:hypothetical protein